MLQKGARLLTLYALVVSKWWPIGRTYYTWKFLLWSHFGSFGNWAVQRCLEAASSADERRKIVSCMRFILLYTTFLSETFLTCCSQGSRCRSRDELLWMPCPSESTRLRGRYSSVNRIRTLAWRPSANSRQQTCVACLEQSECQSSRHCYI